MWSDNLYSGLLALQQDSKDNIRQAAASQLLVYKPAAWDQWCPGRSEQRTAVTIRHSQGNQKPKSQVSFGTRRNACSATALQHLRYHHTPWAAKGQKPCRAGNVTRSCSQGQSQPWFAVHCGSAARDAKPRKTHQDKPAHSLTSQAKNDPCRFPTLCKATILQISSGGWGQMACYIRAINLYTVWPFVDTNKSLQAGILDASNWYFWSTKVHFLQCILHVIYHNMYHVSQYIHASPKAAPQSYSSKFVWWQFPLHVVDGKWCACTEAAENLFKTFQQDVWRQQCKNPNLSSDFDFFLWSWLSMCVPAFPPVQDLSSWGSCEDYLL